MSASDGKSQPTKRVQLTQRYRLQLTTERILIEAENTAYEIYETDHELTAPTPIA